MITKITPPKVQPIELAEVKAHLRLDHAFEDEYLLHLVRVATEAVEQFLGRSLIEQTWQYRWQPGCSHAGNGQFHGEIFEIPLPFPPLIDVVSIHQLSSKGKKSPIQGYSVSHVHQMPRIVMANHLADALEIVYTAGYGVSRADIPPTIRQGILIYIADLYENRHSLEEGVTGVAEQLLSAYRLVRLS